MENGRSERDRIYRENHRSQRREYNKRYRIEHAEQVRDYAKKYNLTNGYNPEYCRPHPERKAFTDRRFFLNNRNKVAGYRNRRREARAAVTLRIIVDSDICGVPTCGEPLVIEAVYPDPLATTIGHEPPLSRLKDLGITTVTERKEHWKCNRWKNRRLDSELPSGRLTG
jgi:hypothetical protein